jgi:hypothetical protein
MELFFAGNMKARNLKASIINTNQQNKKIHAIKRKVKIDAQVEYYLCQEINANIRNPNR